VDWLDLLEDILNGFKRIGIFIFVIALSAGIVWGAVSIILIASGKLPFGWWYVPCWILLLCAIAGAIGSR